MLSYVLTLVICLLVLPFYLMSADFSEDFNNGNMNGWITLDEPAKLLSDKGPSNWVVMQSPIQKFALNQTSNIWGDPPDVIPLGTFAIYDLAEWMDFELTVDVHPIDNDCLGLIWGWKDRTNHYRFITMIDPANPEGAGADKAPWSKIEKRIGDESPYYNTIARFGEASYKENTTTNFKLTVKDSKFTVHSNNKFIVEAKDTAYKGGKIGFTVIAQSGCFFDNVKVTDLSASVDSASKITTTWGRIKSR